MHSQPYNNQSPQQQSQQQTAQGVPGFPHQMGHQRSPITNQVMERTFSIDEVDELGNVWQGTFRVIRPDVMGNTMIQSMQSQICGGYYHDPSNPGCGVPEPVYTQAEIISFLHNTIVDSPPWYDQNTPGGKVYSFRVLNRVYREAIQVDPFRRPKSPEPIDGRGSGGDSYSQHNSTNDPNVVADLVSEEVPTNLTHQG